ncbi:hypothetical protein LWI28_025898 [Acer negundo]|uniref:Beta-galactosidase galactose-binding domain-containing protein n=1 Tax=Acer negundo TaxID=4023 RepID=A0AAD5NTB7_ACENE|nr:hypothetical protein LWI28_025898 [Acer negundo]
MVKKSNEAEEEPASLMWVWRHEIIKDPVLEGKGKFAAMNLKKDDPLLSDDMTLRVNGSGHVLHAYVNGEYLGSEWATYGIFNYKFEKQVKLKPRPNQLALLSATIGLQNYDPMFDPIQFGIPGPVELVERKGDERSPKKHEDDWYKTTFKASLGTDTVVLDLLGMGKCFAWVNGHNIGLYWLSYMAQEDCCITRPCDYRGSYDSNKCLTGCGEPT